MARLGSRFWIQPPVRRAGIAGPGTATRTRSIHGLGSATADGDVLTAVHLGLSIAAPTRLARSRSATAPSNEPAVFGPTGQSVAPISKGAGVLVVAEGDRARIEPLPSVR